MLQYDTKVQAIKEMSDPQNKKDLLTFLGTINYMSKFIPNCSQLMASLRELTKKDVPFVWGTAQQNAFRNMKNVLCKPPVLAYFDINKPIVLSVDSSSEGMGCVIFQEGKPVAYGSRALTLAEKMYSQIEKECLAIVFGCIKFNQYLFGQHFTVETDHKPLISIFKKPMNKCPPRLQRMRVSLQNFDFELKYIPGKEIIVADHLSRSYLKDSSNSEEEKIEAFVMIEQSLNITDTRLNEIKEKTSIDEELKSVLKYIREGWPENKHEVCESAKSYYS